MSEEFIECWYCNMPVTLAERGDNDGFCPHCMCELDLDDYLCQSIATINQLRTELAALKAQDTVGEVVGWYRLDRPYEMTPYPSVCATWHRLGAPVAPLYSAPVSEAKAQGVVIPEPDFYLDNGATPCYYAETVSAALAAAPVQQVSVPDGWRDGYRSAMNSAASGARQLYVQHCHHHGVNGLLDRCRELEQSFIRDADASTSAAPAAPAADAGLAEALKQAFPLFDEDGLNELYHHCEIAVLGDRKRLHKLLAAHSAQGVV